MMVVQDPFLTNNVLHVRGRTCKYDTWTVTDSPYVLVGSVKRRRKGRSLCRRNLPKPKPVRMMS